MDTLDDFIALVRDEIGLEVTVGDAGRGLEEIPDWDSVHLLQLLTALERETGRRISMPDVLEATSLAHIYSLSVAS